MEKININISDYDYLLPEENIAKYPLDERDNSKLLFYNFENIKETKFKTIPELIPSNSRLIFNNTKVIPARIIVKKNTGALIEIFCLNPIYPSDINLNFSSKSDCVWNCFIGNAKKWKQDILSRKIKVNNIDFILSIEKIKKTNQYYEIKFSWDNSNISFSEILTEIGKIPLPPYIKRETEELDKTRYQTVYAKTEGSVASPTAGLHFTNDIINSLKSKNVKINNITLHVGAGTFTPVKENDVNKHIMHNELCIIQKETIIDLLSNNCFNIAVGTTTVRTLESLYWLGVKFINKESNLNIEQWYPYENDKKISLNESLTEILKYLNKNSLSSISFTTELIIMPKYEFKVINSIITNFHQPKSTLLLLVSAFVGEKWKEIYEYALKNNFRFLSYGDSCLFLKTF